MELPGKTGEGPEVGLAIRTEIILLAEFSISFELRLYSGYYLTGRATAKDGKNWVLCKGLWVKCLMESVESLDKSHRMGKTNSFCLIRRYYLPSKYVCRKHSTRPHSLSECQNTIFLIGGAPAGT